ncbi:MAG: hypothetical protein ACI9BW_002568 [Gammaproteobacteria bacterium]|jgi:hypothetical protein
MTMEADQSHEAIAGKIKVKIEPSSVIKDGLFVGANDHYTLSGANEPNSEMIRSILQTNWTKSAEINMQISESMIKLAKD